MIRNGIQGRRRDEPKGKKWTAMRITGRRAALFRLVAVAARPTYLASINGLTTLIQQQGQSISTRERALIKHRGGNYKFSLSLSSTCEKNYSGTISGTKECAFQLEGNCAGQLYIRLVLMPFARFNAIIELVSEYIVHKKKKRERETMFSIDQHVFAILQVSVNL